MNNSRTKRLPKILLGQSAVTLLILLIAGYLIMYSMGYKINFISRKIVKSGMIVLSIDTKPDSIKINGVEKPIKTDSSYILTPGYYDVQVNKNGYIDWSVRTQVEAEIVNYYNNIALFKNDTALNELVDRNKIDYLNAPNSTLAVNAPKGLRYNDYEIWIEEKLITRYSEPITSVSWYTDYRHVAYQQGDEIRIVDDYGQNDTLLVKLPDKTSAKFIFGAKSKELYISQGDKYYIVVIR